MRGASTQPSGSARAAGAQLSKGRIRTASFEGVRGFAALQVSCGHLFSIYVRRATIDLGGGNAVIVFLVMSGLVMVLANHGRNEEARTRPLAFARTFWAKRLARLGPVNWFALALSTPLFSYMIATVPGTDPTGRLVPLSVALTAVFSAAWIPRGPDMPLWNLTPMVVFYFIFPAVLPHVCGRRPAAQFLRVCIACWLAYVVLWLVSAALAPPDFLMGAQPMMQPTYWATMRAHQPSLYRFMCGYIYAHRSPANKLPLFVLGAVAGNQLAGQLERHEGTQAHAHAPTRGLPWAWVANGCTALYCGYAALQAMSPTLLLLLPHPWPHEALLWLNCSLRCGGDLLIAPCATLWLYALTQAPGCASERLLLSQPLLRRVGSISFAWYCLHAPTFEYYAWLRFAGRDFWAHFVDGAEPMLTYWDVLPALACVALVSYGTHHLVEEPGGRALLKWLTRPRAASSTANRQASSAAPPAAASPAPEQALVDDALPSDEDDDGQSLDGPAAATRHHTLRSAHHREVEVNQVGAQML